MTVNYYINGVTFSSLGVYISGSKGIIDGLKMKDPAKALWPEYHGELVDLAAPRFEAREITLDCYVKADSSTDFILAVQAFLAAFQKTGLQRLMIDVDDGDSLKKPLVYEVYMPDSTAVDKKWRPTAMVGTFTIKLIEPEPVKTVYKFVASGGSMTVNITLTTADPCNIYWGDGTNITDIITSSGQKSRTYTGAGTYYIIITGIIENLTGVTTNATLVWSRL